MCFICGRRWSGNRRKRNGMNRKSGTRRSKSPMNGSRRNSFRMNSCWSCWKRNSWSCWSCWNGSYLRNNFLSFWCRKKNSWCCLKIRWNGNFRRKNCFGKRSRCGNCRKSCFWKQNPKNCFWRRLPKSFLSLRRTCSWTTCQRTSAIRSWLLIWKRGLRCRHKKTSLQLQALHLRGARQPMNALRLRLWSLRLLRHGW